MCLLDVVGTAKILSSPQNQSHFSSPRVLTTLPIPLALIEPICTFAEQGINGTFSNLNPLKNYFIFYLLDIWGTTNIPSPPQNYYHFFFLGIANNYIPSLPQLVCTFIRQGIPMIQVQINCTFFKGSPFMYINTNMICVAYLCVYSKVKNCTLNVETNSTCWHHYYL